MNKKRISLENTQKIIMKYVLVLISCSAVLFLVGCSSKSSGGCFSSHYENTAAFLDLPSCKATMAQKAPCVRRFITKDGKEFTVGGPDADRKVISFLGTLEEKKMYSLPGEFQKYLNEHKEED